MAEGQEVITNSGGVTRRRVAILRWWLAYAMTFGLLGYAALRLLVTRMAHSARETTLEFVVAAGVIASCAITWNLGAAFSEKWSRRTRPIIFGMWLATVAIGIAMKTGTQLPRPIVATLFVIGSLWVPWVAWLRFRPAPLRQFLSEAVLVALGPVVMFQTMTLSSMTGGNELDFRWTWSKARDREVVIVESQPSVITTGFEPTSHDFPQFLGPNRTAVIDSLPRPTDWNEHPPREVWRKKVGPGWSGFATRGDYAFTQEQRGDDEAVVCYRIADGDSMWTTKAPARFESAMGGTGPRATPTITPDGLIYAIGATGMLQCLDGCSGTVKWSKNVMTDNSGADHNHGICGSPAVDGDRLYVAVTGNAKASLVAYNRTTGERLWQAGQSLASYSSPIVLELAGRRQVLLHTQKVLESHDLDSGELLWVFPWGNENFNNCSEPIVIDAAAGELIVCTGYGVGAARIQVTPAEPRWTVKTQWTSREMRTKFSTGVRLGDQIYGLDDSILECINISDGKRRWKNGRYNFGQVLLVGKTLLIQAEQGDLALVDPQPGKFVEFARIPMLKGKTWNNPTVAGKYLLVRNSEEAVCLEWPEAN